MNLLDNIFCHDELSKINNESRKVTDEKDHDNTDKNNRQVHLVMLTRFILSLRSEMSIPGKDKYAVIAVKLCWLSKYNHRPNQILPLL